ncbi:phosphoglycerate kinase [Bacteroidota bacterium]|nr:phosphoglycerate kinase [Bacteroidota bacterium]
MENIDFKNKKVLVRVDFNVPLSSTFQITDDNRIKASLPTLNYILENGGALILCSHLGRPQQKKLENGELNVAKFTLNHLTSYLSAILNRPVSFISDCIGSEAVNACNALKPGEVILLENTRFYPGEEKGDKEMAGILASLADVYINDAFGTAHRAHASTTLVANFFAAGNKGFGFLMKAEIENARHIIESPEKPFTAIIGGAKVSDKMLLLDKMLDQVDNLIIGGGMAFTFIKAKGGQIGNSLVELDRLDLALQLMEKAKSKSVNLLLPVDVIAANTFSNDAEKIEVSSDNIPEGWLGLDIGPKAVETFVSTIKSAKTILWNGPMGVFEMSSFAKGTLAIAESVAEATQNGAYSLVGGGDSVAAVTQVGLSDAVSYVSTGGGALLEMLEGKVLPGVKAISE